MVGGSPRRVLHQPEECGRGYAPSSRLSTRRGRRRLEGEVRRLGQAGEGMPHGPSCPPRVGEEGGSEGHPMRRLSAIAIGLAAPRRPREGNANGRPPVEPLTVLLRQDLDRTEPDRQTVAEVMVETLLRKAIG